MEDLTWGGQGDEGRKKTNLQRVRTMEDCQRCMRKRRTLGGSASMGSTSRCHPPPSFLPPPSSLRVYVGASILPVRRGMRGEGNDSVEYGAGELGIVGRLLSLCG